MTELTRTLALDVGDARVGIAISDPMGISITPLGVVDRSGDRRCIEKILELIREHKVAKLIVGMPFSLDGSLGPQAEKVQRFINKLEENTADLSGFEVLLWDERLTTVEANEMLRGSKLRNRKKREALDTLSAAIILENYLASTRAVQL